MKNFTTVLDLIEYSNNRFKIRFMGNRRIHRACIATIKNCISKNISTSNCKERDQLDYEKAIIELEFREIVKSMRLPISSKIK